MSRITTIMTAMRAELATLFPSHQELDFPSVPEENDILALEQGVGLASLSGVNTNRLVGCKFSVQRDILITFTRQTCAVNTDRDANFSNELALLEDHYALVNSFEDNATLDALVARIAYVSDTGVVPIFIEETQFNMIQVNFQIEYLEEFT